MDNAQNRGGAYAGHGSCGLAASRNRPPKATAFANCNYLMGVTQLAFVMGDGLAQNKHLAKVTKRCGVSMAPADELDRIAQTWPSRLP